MHTSMALFTLLTPTYLYLRTFYFKCSTKRLVTRPPRGVLWEMPTGLLQISYNLGTQPVDTILDTGGRNLDTFLNDPRSSGAQFG